jgi:hypothetical protein
MWQLNRRPTAAETLVISILQGVSISSAVHMISKYPALTAM